MEDKVCKNCNAPIRKIYFPNEKEWLHVTPEAGFPTMAKGTLWRHCKLSVAEPEQERDSVVKVLAMASDRTAFGLLSALNDAGYKVVEKGNA